MPVSLQSSLTFSLSIPHDCHYLPGRLASLLVAEPTAPMTNSMYSLLIRNGFRRSGGFIYRPFCRQCAECRPLRVLAADFQPNRIQHRIAVRNADLAATPVSTPFTKRHYSLYSRYIRRRHAEGNMFPPSMEDLQNLVGPPWACSQVVEFTLDDELVAVAINDQLDDGFSAVYSFFEPDLSQRSLGKYTILWQLEQLKLSGRGFFYLGYAIDGCPKMSYKDEFLPHETLCSNTWRPVKRRS
jgi:arginine-tRNA-protein transferase